MKKVLMPTVPSVTRRSPLKALTGLNMARLQLLDEKWFVQSDMAIGEEKLLSINIYDSLYMNKKLDA